MTTATDTPDLPTRVRAIAREAANEIHPWTPLNEGEGSAGEMQEAYDENEANIVENHRMESAILRAIRDAIAATGAKEALETAFRCSKSATNDLELNTLQESVRSALAAFEQLEKLP